MPITNNNSIPLDRESRIKCQLLHIYVYVLCIYIPMPMLALHIGIPTRKQTRKAFHHRFNYVVISQNWSRSSVRSSEDDFFQPSYSVYFNRNDMKRKKNTNPSWLFLFLLWILVEPIIGQLLRYQMEITICLGCRSSTMHEKKSISETIDRCWPASARRSFRGNLSYSPKKHTGERKASEER